MFGFLLLNLGLRYASASKVTMISVAQLVLLTLLGAFVLHEPTNVFVWIGLNTGLYRNCPDTRSRLKGMIADPQETEFTPGPVDFSAFGSLSLWRLPVPLGMP